MMSLAVGGLGQGPGGFDSLPPQQLIGQSLGDDPLEVLDALGFDAFALRLLAFFIQDEAHLLGLLVRGQLGVDGLHHQLGQIDFPQQDGLHDYPPLAQVGLPGP